MADLNRVMSSRSRQPRTQKDDGAARIPSLSPPGRRRRGGFARLRGTSAPVLVVLCLRRAEVGRIEAAATLFRRIVATAELQQALHCRDATRSGRRRQRGCVWQVCLFHLRVVDPVEFHEACKRVTLFPVRPQFVDAYQRWTEDICRSPVRSGAGEERPAQLRREALLAPALEGRAPRRLAPQGGAPPQHGLAPKSALHAVGSLVFAAPAGMAAGTMAAQCSGPQVGVIAAAGAMPRLACTPPSGHRAFE
uniref:Uncharacterized protein n=1 Tax=Pyrodinium bahamense TaxID=73915 RepID=A0A7S0ATQ3_9DINO